MNCAVILARGGSKGCKGKNKRLLNGVPLISRAVRTVKASGVCDEVIVATDDKDIMALAHEEGVYCVMRSTVSDSQTSEQGLMELEPYFRKYENMALIQCTAPMMFPEDVRLSLDCMLRYGHQSACAVAPFHGVVWTNPPNGFRLPRQERPAEYLEAGSVYWMNVESFKVYQTRFCGTTGMLTIPPERCIEIDSEEDFRIAECLISNIKELDSGYHW